MKKDNEVTNKIIYTYPDEVSMSFDLLLSRERFENQGAHALIPASFTKNLHELYLDTTGHMTIKQIEAISARRDLDVRQAAEDIVRFCRDSAVMGKEKVADVVEKSMEKFNLVWGKDAIQKGLTEEQMDKTLDEVKPEMFYKNLSGGSAYHLCAVKQEDIVALSRSILSGYKELNKENPDLYSNFDVMQYRGKVVTITPLGALNDNEKGKVKAAAERGYR